MDGEGLGVALSLGQLAIGALFCVLAFL